MSGDSAVMTESTRISGALPDYDVERELGRGGMGIVYLGRHRRLDRGVAIKELPPSFAAEPEVRERFSTEARTLATLSHPHIVPIFDYVEREGMCLIVMEQLPGGTVWDRFTSTGLTPPTACAVVMACCAALQHAHTKGVLHLDVKPDNLMFDADSAVKVTDFGIARVISGGRTMGTVDGRVLGTPAYMSPEQARGEDLTPASDVYAAGVMLYELLSGQLPWQGAESASELLSQRLREDPIPLGEPAPHVPLPIADVVMTSLSRDVATRYQHAEDLGVAIGEACADSWGTGWLDHAGIAIIGSERLTRAARTTSHGGFAAAVPAPPTSAGLPSSPGRAANETVARGAADVPGAGSTVVTGRAGSVVHGAGETGVVGSSPLARDEARGTVARGVTPGESQVAPATGAGVPVSPAEPAAPARSTIGPTAPGDFEMVRAAAEQPRIEGADLYQLELADLIGVEDMLDPPKPPWPALVITAGLVAATVLVALLGPGDADRAGTLAAGQVAIGGVDVVAAGRVEVDLSEEVVVQIEDRSLATQVDEVELRLGYVGASVTVASAPVRDGRAVVDPGIAQRTISGAATATVVLTSDGAVVAEQELGIEATQTPYLTIPFIGGVLLLLLALANLESSLKPLRSGRRRIRSYVGSFVWGGLAGVAVVPISGSLGFDEPAIGAAVITAALGALAGAAAARARVGVARRARVRRAVQRAERTLRVHVPTP